VALLVVEKLGRINRWLYLWNDRIMKHWLSFCLGRHLPSGAVRRCPQSPERRRGISDFEDVRPQADELTEHITVRGITPLPFWSCWRLSPRSRIDPIMGLPRADGCRLPAELRDVPASHLASCDDYLTKKLPA